MQENPYCPISTFGPPVVMVAAASRFYVWGSFLGLVLPLAFASLRSMPVVDRVLSYHEIPAALSI